MAKYVIEIGDTDAYKWMSASKMGTLVMNCIMRMALGDENFLNEQEWQSLLPQEKSVIRCLHDNLTIKRNGT